jgi:hypothetical protein
MDKDAKLLAATRGQLVDEMEALMLQGANVDYRDPNVCHYYDDCVTKVLFALRLMWCSVARIPP